MKNIEWIVIFKSSQQLAMVMLTKLIKTSARATIKFQKRLSQLKKNNSGNTLKSEIDWT